MPGIDEPPEHLAEPNSAKHAAPADRAGPGTDSATLACAVHIVACLPNPLGVWHCIDRKFGERDDASPDREKTGTGLVVEVAGNLLALVV